MTRSDVDPARVVIEALRLDRWSPDEVERRADRALALGVGGFILFGGEAERVGRLVERIRDDAARSLWIGADLERGAGQQIRGLTELPPPAALAAHSNPGAAVAAAGRVTARDALSVGINWVIAPVLDLDAEPDNPIIATRSFGADPRRVGELGVRWIDACQSAGAAACAKHFPGHGRTTEDSHIGLPSIGAPAELLEEDLAPFAAAANRVASVMVAHVAYPALGGRRAATVEPDIVSGLLRGRLGFEGVVTTDAMIMGGAGPDAASAAVGAVGAGCDLICYPADAEAAVASLARAADDPRFAARLQEASTRSTRSCPPSARASRPEFEPVAFARDTIAGDAEVLRGWTPRAPTRVVGVSDDPDVGPPAGRAGALGTIVADDLRAAGWRVTDSPDAGQCIVVLAATPRGWKGRGAPAAEVVERTRALVRSARRGLVVLLGHRRWLDVLGVPGICAWSTETVMERAAAEWLCSAVGAVAGARPGRADR
ncbi:glycoside hydrolase family 3 N-terminal domain-containing protein [Candidatus Palauibacter irciniicola]|uniref:glycoside hydrolase family 3 N-terminal domain-containing protein n=1 Tax=Candidatus Palauibacter irciniicola TaxID=3056733 RepID=UPI003B0115E9